MLLAYFACGRRRGYTQRNHRYARTLRIQRNGETEGLKALRTFSEESDLYDLALLDHGMADVTGLELAQRMRRIRPGFPVVVYTGYFDTPTAEQLEAAGIGGRVIIKPTTLRELADAIQEALGGWQRPRALRRTGVAYAVMNGVTKRKNAFK
jgi:CheY-like chemotaxis protein